jgi:AAA ATPase domain
MARQPAGTLGFATVDADHDGQDSMRDLSGRTAQLTTLVDLSDERRSTNVTHARGFVGRAAELLLVRDHVAQALVSNSRTVLVEGVRGSGLSGFVSEALRPLGNMRVAMVQCWSDASPLWPWHEVLRSLDAQDLRRQVWGRGRLHPAQHENTSLFHLFESIVHELDELAMATPLVVVLDDLHRADVASVALAHFATRRSRGSRWCLLATSHLVETSDRERPHVSAAISDAMQQALGEFAQDCDRFRLNELTRAEVCDYLAVRGYVCDEATVDIIRVLTSGLPQRLSELDRASAGRGLMEGIDETIGAHISRLDEATRHVLATAAVLSRELTLGELSTVVSMPPDAIALLLSEPAVRPLVLFGADGRVAFAHDRIRTVLSGTLRTDERLAAHGMAAKLHGNESDATSAVASARHAMQVWGRSKEDSLLAIEQVARAAELLRNTGSAHEAAELLSDAASVGERLGWPASRAALLLDWGRTLLTCGRLGDSRLVLRHAMTAAESERAPGLLAEAALLVGGIWMNEQRAAGDTAVVAGAQRRALALLTKLPADDGSAHALLKVRLELRIAAERNYWSDDPMAPVVEALRRLREIGDPSAIAEGLSFFHHLILEPELADERELIAAELLDYAGRSQSKLLVLMALCWRCTNAFLSGSTDAPRRLNELISKSEEDKCAGLRYVASAMQVMLAIREGLFEEAESLAGHAFESGRLAGDRDAAVYFAGHLAAIRMFQGRGEELAEHFTVLERNIPLHPNDWSMRAGAALFALRGSNPVAAKALMNEVCLGRLPKPSSTSLMALAACAEIANELNDADAANKLYDALLPLAHLPVMGSLGIVCFGPASRFCALAALTGHRLDEAHHHGITAIGDALMLGHRPALAMCHATLADVLARRHDPKANDAYSEAINLASKLSMSGWVDRWQKSSDAWRVSVVQRTELVRIQSSAADTWEVSLGAHTVFVPFKVGVNHLARLVAQPGEPISALSLVAGWSTKPSLEQPLLDRRALENLKKRAAFIRMELDSAADHERQSLQSELDDVVDAISSALGLGGRRRSFSTDAERARVAVRKAILRAVSDIELRSPSIGLHLREHIHTGVHCQYMNESSK